MLLYELEAYGFKTNWALYDMVSQVIHYELGKIVNTVVAYGQPFYHRRMKKSCDFCRELYQQL